jgi:hypothetical protein
MRSVWVGGYHDIMCLCFTCVSARYIDGVHCGSCMAHLIEVESTEQCQECYDKYAQENRRRYEHD